LGLKEVARVDNTERGGGLCVLLRDPLSGSKLELNFYPPGSRFAHPFDVGEGLDHLCFRVDDLPGSLRTLESEGIRPIDLPDQIADGESIACIQDPDGIWIELWRDQRWGRQPMPEG